MKGGWLCSDHYTIKRWQTKADFRVHFGANGAFHYRKNWRWKRVRLREKAAKRHAVMMGHRAACQRREYHSGGVAYVWSHVHGDTAVASGVLVWIGFTPRKPGQCGCPKEGPHQCEIPF